ncbi:hypothetical protein C0992_004712 [Termitomyces sp. T32_za158]|nr:hypothetical protein C0992_004712 [Termitomyces sp. T32_za158]
MGRCMAVAGLLRGGGARLGSRLGVKEDEEGAPATGGGGAGGGPTAVEGVPTLVGTPRLWLDKGKRKAVLESEVPRRMRRWLFLVPPAFEGGPLGSNIFSLGSGHLLPSITVRQGPPEILRAEMCRLQEEIEGLREEVRVARQEHDEVARA